MHVPPAFTHAMEAPSLPQVAAGLRLPEHLADARRALLEEEALPGAVLEAALWVDDAAALDEACRCAAALLPTAGDEPGVRRCRGGLCSTRRHAAGWACFAGRHHPTTAPCCACLAWVLGDCPRQQALAAA